LSPLIRSLDWIKLTVADLIDPETGWLTTAPVYTLALLKVIPVKSLSEMPPGIYELAAITAMASARRCKFVLIRNFLIVCPIFTSKVTLQSILLTTRSSTATTSPNLTHAFLAKLHNPGNQCFKIDVFLESFQFLFGRMKVMLLKFNFWK
jgi:hypothetical protein